jgi:His/Glu/Gln/Arg/opine family amino acid ABC transporter permease subunit
MDVVIAWLPRLGQAALVTCGLFAVIAVLSTLAGLAMALSESGPGGRVLARVYLGVTGVLRGIPELVVLLFCYLGLPMLGVDLGPAGSAILGFALVGCAYDYQVFRGALAAVPAGQIEAARALGLSRWHAMAITPWITYATGAVKRLSIASAIAVAEIMHVTKQAIAVTGQPFQFIVLAMVLYGGLASVMMVAEMVVSRRLQAHDRPRPVI